MKKNDGLWVLFLLLAVALAGGAALVQQLARLYNSRQTADTEQTWEQEGQSPSETSFHAPADFANETPGPEPEDAQYTQLLRLDRQDMAPFLSEEQMLSLQKRPPLAYVPVLLLHSRAVLNAKYKAGQFSEEQYAALQTQMQDALERVSARHGWKPDAQTQTVPQ